MGAAADGRRAATWPRPCGRRVAAWPRPCGRRVAAARRQPWLNLTDAHPGNAGRVTMAPSVPAAIGQGRAGPPARVPPHDAARSPARFRTIRAPKPRVRPRLCHSGRRRSVRRSEREHRSSQPRVGPFRSRSGRGGPRSRVGESRRAPLGSGGARERERDCRSRGYASPHRPSKGHECPEIRAPSPPNPGPPPPRSRGPGAGAAADTLSVIPSSGTLNGGGSGGGPPRTAGSPRVRPRLSRRHGRAAGDRWAVGHEEVA